MPPAPSAEPSASLSAFPAVASVSTGTVLFALDRSEWTRFFPDGFAPLSDRARTVFCDVTGMTRQAWTETVMRSRPRIIVSAWLTPAIQESFVTSHGGPVEYVCHVAGSVRHLVTRELLADGLKVSNWGGLVAPIVAEHALLLTLAGLRNLGSWREVLGWPDHLRRERLSTRRLRDKRVAIHGFGAIARELVSLLGPFDVRISAYSAGVPEGVMQKLGVRPCRSLEELCHDADVFVTCEALTPATTGVIDARVLARLPDGAVFVNVGRGRLVDENALLRLAREKRLRIASDVFIREPVPSDSPFVDLPEALVSPHIGGPTDDLYPVCGQYALANVNRHLAGQSIDSRVTEAVYDRST